MICLTFSKSWCRLAWKPAKPNGKALRTTVKSCVGTSWCRYGQQDSVTMAVTLENRYKGLRAPHKIKSVIATQAGYNLLYVAMVERGQHMPGFWPRPAPSSSACNMSIGS